ncbi:MAG TPA: hypothetical protein VFF27_02150 [Bacteroidia bacterium]|jgi:hypothetical protein|nr:hypothetical protein [Bacteroidia bacterium]
MKTNKHKTNSGRKVIVILSLFMTLFGHTAFADAAANRAYILSKLKFYYIANPNTDTTKSLLTLSSSASDARNVFGGNASMTSMVTFLKSLLNDRANGGDESFQSAFKQILNIRDKVLAVFMYNDVAPFNTFAKNTFINCVDAAGYQWPCATNSKTGPYFGKIHIGRHFFSAQSSVNANFVLLHELTHTQDMSEFPQHPFYVNGSWYHYGADGTHYYDEAVPSMGFAFMEGIANAFAYQFGGAQSYGPALATWFSPTREIRVEMATPSPTPGASNDIWLYTQLTAAGVTPISTSGGYAKYRLSQLPARFIVHNEMVIANILLAYMYNISFTRVARALKQYNLGPTSVFSGNGNLQTMMTGLCQAGLPESMQAQSFPSCANFPDRKEYLLPLAYADYFTGFSSTSLSAFNQLFDNGMNADLIQCYWNNRTAVKNAATAASVRNFTQASTEIAIALGINSSIMEH